MALTATKSTESLTSHRAPKRAERDQAGWITRWARRDPVRTAATVLIVFHLLWRADIASRGYLTGDDFTLVAPAAESDLTLAYLFTPYNDHILPGVALIYWLLTRATGLAFWPYLLLIIAGHAAVAVAFYRLLRLIMPPGWGVLIPLSLLLFSPLTLATSWTVVALVMLPMQLAMVLAIGAQVKYVRTGRRRHLVTLTMSVALGLAFDVKALLIVPLVFLLTACLLVTGSPVRSLTRTVRRYWPSWLVLTALALAYLGLYLSVTTPAVRNGLSVSEVLTFIRQIVGSNLIPGLVGGPWQWVDAHNDMLPLAGPPFVVRWLALAAFLAVVVITVRLRPSAVRAWVLLGIYVALIIGLFTWTRLPGPYSAVTGLVPYYIADAVVVAGLCIGVALFGHVDAAAPALEHEANWLNGLRSPRTTAVMKVLAIIPLVALSAGVAWSGAGFNQIWSVKHGRDYLHNAQADLEKAPAGTVFFDQPVPDGVISSLSWPHNMQSQFFRALEPGPVFVTEAEDLSIFDAAGHIRPAAVVGTPTRPGPVQGCGYQLASGETIRMPLIGPMVVWHWVIRVGYLSSGQSTAVLRLRGATYQFEIQRGLHQIFFPIVGGGDAVELRVTDPSVTLCVDQITVGNLAPRQ